MSGLVLTVMLAATALMVWLAAPSTGRHKLVDGHPLPRRPHHHTPPRHAAPKGAVAPEPAGAAT